MHVHVLCTDRNHPVFPYLEQWRAARIPGQDIEIFSDESNLTGGDILFLISASRLIPKSIRERYRAAIVLHASDVPRGRGWSPLVWQVLEGARVVVVTALTARDKVDSGEVWAQHPIHLEDHEVFEEINDKLFKAELQLMDRVIDGFDALKPVTQSPNEASYYRKRTPEDSRIDPDKTLSEQFDLLRICDPVRYPAFFDLRGHRYRIMIEKLG